MSELFDVALRYFAEKGWPVARHETLPILRLEYEGDNGRWFCYARVREESNQFIFLSILTEKAPEDRRPVVAEFLTRANFGLNIGNFEMDFDDGEIRYKTSVDVSQDRLTPGLIDPLVKASLVAMDDYLPGIQAVIAGKATPGEAIEKILEDEADYDFTL